MSSISVSLMSTAACEESIQEGSAAVRGAAPALPAGFPPLGSTSWHREQAILPCPPGGGPRRPPCSPPARLFTLARPGELYAWRPVRILAPDHPSLLLRTGIFVVVVVLCCKCPALR